MKFPLTHDLGALVALLRERVDATAFLPLTAYTPFYIQYRYHATGRDMPIDRKAALRQAQTLWQHVAQESVRLASQDTSPTRPRQQ